ncbi:MAG TPA: carboxymuconolactone decarboxylase family protein [Acidimicrobiales bacterium]|nr:carboxymuconolactone decarboxylase family protein [Acidimicrobiales bacterium]
MGHFHDVIAELRQPTRDLRGLAPEAMGGFGQLHAAAMADGALSTKVKELMALSISITTHCEGCIAYHAKGAAAAGATEAEVVEAISVALLMSGGPATTYGPMALSAYREFAED